MAQEAGRKPRHSGGHPVYCPAHDVSDHLPIGKLCVHTQGKLKLSIESRDITVLGTMDLLEMRGTFTVLKLRRKMPFWIGLWCYPRLISGCVCPLLSSSKCSGAAGVWARCFKIFSFIEGSDHSRTVVLFARKALVLLDLEYLRALFASASEEEHGKSRYR